MTNPYRVVVVVDRGYGNRLFQVPEGVPVWIVDTPLNREAAQQRWAERGAENHLTGITTFKAADKYSAEDILLAELDTIDLHHGSYSTDPPYTILEVIGARLTERIKAVLARYGFNEFRSSKAGFFAVRHPMDEHSADVRLLLDCNSLHRAKSGPIWGGVWFSAGNCSFPEAGWSDIAVAFCCAWLNALRRLATGRATAESVFFMDGPFLVKLTLQSPANVQLEFVCSRQEETVECTSVPNIHALIEDAMSCGQSAMAVAAKNGWERDNDVLALSREMVRLKTLRPR